MTKRIFIYLTSLIGILKLYSQQDTFYMPFQMPDYTAIRFNSFLSNPAFGVIGYKQQNVNLYYRNHYMSYKDPSFSLMGLGYGNKWSDSSAVNAFLYKQTQGVFQNMGIVLNYGHRVLFSDSFSLSLALSVTPSYSGLDSSKMIALEPSDPIFVTDKTIGLQASPGFSINYKDFYIGGQAQNIFDYSFANKKKMTIFADKIYTTHLMWRKSLEGEGLFEESQISALVKGIYQSGVINAYTSVLYDISRLGWVSVGFSQRAGVFSQLGFHFRKSMSLGFEYENGLGAKIPQLGHSVGVYLSMEFGGDRQKDFKPYERKRKMPKPTPKIELPKREPEAEILSATRDDNDVASVIPPGYYIIANVYSTPEYAQRYKKKLEKHFAVSSFVHPKNNMTYIYIKTPVFNSEAATKFYKDNKENPIFPKGIWIMHVTAKRELEQNNKPKEKAPSLIPMPRTTTP